MWKEEEPAAAPGKGRGARRSRRRRPGAGEGKAYELSRGAAAAGRGPPLRHPPLRSKPQALAVETPEAALWGAATVEEGATGRKDVCSLSSSSSISRKSGQQRRQPRLRCTLRTAAVAAAATPRSLAPLLFANLLQSFPPPQWRRQRRAPSRAQREARAAGACRRRRPLRRSRTRSSSRSRKKCRRRWRSFERKTRLSRTR